MNRNKKSKINPWVSLIETAIPLVLFFFLSKVYFQEEWGIYRILMLFICGALFFHLTILTHEAAHYTWSGIKWLDRFFPRILMSFAGYNFSKFCYYHHLHHRFSGRNINDPEHVLWTKEEYDKSSTYEKWFYRNRPWLIVFFLGGIGHLLTIKQLRKSKKLPPPKKAIQKLIVVDYVIIFLTHITLLYVAYTYGQLLPYIIFYFVVVERITVGIHFFREICDHYGLWGQHNEGFYQVQLSSSRNIESNFLTSIFFRNINYHTSHHLFPNKPWKDLPHALPDSTVKKRNSYFKIYLSIVFNPVLLHQGKIIKI